MTAASLESKHREEYTRRLKRAMARNQFIAPLLEADKRISAVQTTHELIALISDEDADMRSSAVWLLGRIGGNEAAKALGRVAEYSDDPDLRASAADAMSCIRTKQSGAILRRLLTDSPIEKVRERAASSLRFHKATPATTDALISVLLNRSETPYVREMVAEALQFHPEGKVVPAVEQVLDDPAPTVRYWAISALSYTKAVHLIQRLEEIARTDHAEASDPDLNMPDYMPPKVSEIAAEVAERIRRNVTQLE